MYNLISEVLFHHLCCILSTRNKSLGETHTQGEGLQRYEYQEVQELWGPLQKLTTIGILKSSALLTLHQGLTKIE